MDTRINRLVGQIEGIRRMINSKRKSGDVVQQILAAREALTKIGF
jgi:DNA-binding FrmR family transcriptional regulator